MRREDLPEKLVTTIHLSVPEREALGLASIPRFNANGQKWHNVGVEPRRALWEAFLTVCVPSLAVWMVVAIVLDSTGKVSYSEGLPIYLILFLFPCPLIFPIYRRYLRGPESPKARSRRFHIVWAILYGALAIICIVAAIPAFRRHKGLEDWSQLAMALFWGWCCVESFYRASKAEAFKPSS